MLGHICVGNHGGFQHFRKFATGNSKDYINLYLDYFLMGRALLILLQRTSIKYILCFYFLSSVRVVLCPPASVFHSLKERVIRSVIVYSVV